MPKPTWKVYFTLEWDFFSLENPPRFPQRKFLLILPSAVMKKGSF